MEQKKNIGIELLRIILMLFIIEGHLLTHTQIRESLKFLSEKWIIVWGVQAITVSCVNTFVFITGYYLSSKEISWKKIFKLWGEVVFYSIGIEVIFILIFGWKGISSLKSFMPLIFHQYWFFSIYIYLLILSPFLNIGIDILDENKHKILIIILVLICFIKLTIFPFAPQVDLSEGMGIVSFVSIYIIGGYFRKYKINIKRKLLLIFVAGIIVFLSKVVLEIIIRKLDLNLGTGILYHYNTILQLIIAILLFLIFKEFKINKKYNKAITFFSRGVFGVYLIHEHPQIRNLIWKKWITKEMLLESDLMNFLCLIIFIPFVIFLIAILIEKVRIIALEKGNNLIVKYRRKD